MAKVAKPPEPIRVKALVLHVILVIVALVTAKVIDDSHHPTVAVIALALVLSVELPVAAWKLLRAKL
jgi:hypothetical protein